MQKYTKINKYEYLSINVVVNSLRSWMLKSTIHYTMGYRLKRNRLPWSGKPAWLIEYECAEMRLNY